MVSWMEKTRSDYIEELSLSSRALKAAGRYMDDNTNFENRKKFCFHFILSRLVLLADVTDSSLKDFLAW